MGRKGIGPTLADFGDIYPWMGSVYHCAGTSSHDRAIHPAFNGDPIVIGGQTSKKGFGGKAKSAFMFMVNGRADRFQAVVAIDKSDINNQEREDK